MGIFQNDFFSIAGQKERFANVGNTLLSAVGIRGGGVVSNTGVKPLDTALSAVASHPFITAGVAAAVINPSSAVAFTKVVGKAAAGEFSKLSLGGKALTVVATPVIISAVASSSKLQKGIINAPSSLAQFGGNLGSLAEDPTLENLTRVAKDNPVLTAAAGVTGLLAVGTAVRGVAGIIATTMNTNAVKANTANSNISELYPNSVAGNSALVAPVTDSSIKTPTILAQKGAATSRKRRKTKSKDTGRITQNVKVYNIDDRDVSDRKVYKGIKPYR